MALERQRIIFGGRVLKEEEKRLTDYGIQNEMVIHLVEKEPNAPERQPQPERQTNFRPQGVIIGSISIEVERNPRDMRAIFRTLQTLEGHLNIVGNPIPDDALNNLNDQQYLVLVRQFFQRFGR